MMNVTAAELGPQRDKSANNKGTLAVPRQTARRRAQTSLLRLAAPCRRFRQQALRRRKRVILNPAVALAPAPGLGPTSLLYVSHQFARVDFRAIDIPIGIGGSPSRGAAGSRSGTLLHRLRIRDQRGDPAVLCAADPQTTPEARILRCVGFGIGDIDGVAGIDIDAARPAELLPFDKEFPILVEDLDAIVG